MRKKVFGVIFTVFGIIAVLIVAVLLKKEDGNEEKPTERTIELTQKCFDVEVYGGDGEAWAVTTLNNSEIEALFKEKINPEYEYGYEWLATARKIKETTTISVNKKEKISNGDELIITINFSEDILDKYDLIVPENSFVYEVMDLPDNVRFDPFDGVYFNVYENEKGETKIDLCYYNEFLKYYNPSDVFDFFTSDNKPLSIEEFGLNEEIVFCLDEKMIEEYALVGYTPTQTSKKYVIKGEEKVSLVKNSEELTDEFLTELKGYSDNIVLSKYEEYDWITSVSLELQGMYFNNINEVNRLVLLYKVIVNYGEGNKSETVYITSTTGMIYINELGENIVLGYANEIGDGSVLVDPNTMHQVRGEKLFDIMDRLKEYTKL